MSKGERGWEEEGEEEEEEEETTEKQEEEQQQRTEIAWDSGAILWSSAGDLKSFQPWLLERTCLTNVACPQGPHFHPQHHRNTKEQEQHTHHICLICEWAGGLREQNDPSPTGNPIPTLKNEEINPEMFITWKKALKCPTNEYKV